MTFQPKCSTRDRVVALALEGVTPAEIEARTGLTRATIHNDLRAARASGVDIPRFPTRGGGVGQFRLVVPRSVIERLESPAKARNMTSRALAARLLDVITADGDLTAAVLDDGISASAGE